MNSEQLPGKSVQLPKRQASPAPQPLMDKHSIQEAISKQHAGFMSRYSCLVEKYVQDRNLNRSKTNARLRLVASIFRDAGVVSDYKDVDILGYPSSVVLFPKIGEMPVYLLNDCDQVVAAAGDVMGQYAMTARLVMVTNARNVGGGFYASFNGVLFDDSFDWMAFCVFLLERIHELVYRRSDIMRDLFGNNFKEIKNV